METDHIVSTTPERKAEQRYRYEASYLTGLKIGMCCGLGLSLMSIAAAIGYGLRSRGGDLAGVALGLCFAAFFALAILLPAFAKSDVIVDEEAISWSFFGKTWRTIPWNRMYRIRIHTYTDNYRNWPKGGLTTMYKIDQSASSTLLLSGGFIQFDDSIVGFESLVKTLNTQARKNNVPTIEKR